MDMHSGHTELKGNISLVSQIDNIILCTRRMKELVSWPKWQVS